MTETKKNSKPKKTPKPKLVKVKDQTIEVMPQRGNAKIDIEKAVKLRANGATYEEIANVFNMAAPSVWQALKPYAEDLDKLIVYRDNKTALQETVQAKILDAIATKDINQEKLTSLASALQIIGKETRLDRGEATSNVSMKIAHIDLGEYNTVDVTEGE